MKKFDTRPKGATLHHGTHRHLLTHVRVAEAQPASIDAIIVPAARPVHWLREAMKLADTLSCGLVAMCSGSVRAVEVAELGESAGVPVIAMDVGDHDYGLPPFSADTLFDRTVFQRTSDTSAKRNLALWLAQVAGWERVLFLDDDIYSITPGDARAAAGLLTEFEAVGMYNSGYPDNSVVCHAHRELGAEQDQFIGAGALAVSPTRCRSFFPDTYNEDWFFLLGCGPRIAITGRMRQKYYDPFADPDRARREELGDCLAEGLFWLLDQHLATQRADLEHWGKFLNRRARFIDMLITELSTRAEGRHGKRRLASLQVARATSAMITPGLCSEYVHRWRRDLETWRAFIRVQPIDLGVEKAMVHLNWPVERSTIQWPGSGGNGVLDEDPLACSDGWRGSAENSDSSCPPDCTAESPQLAPALAHAGAGI